MKEDLPELVHDLMRVSAYGAPPGTPISLRTTHTSWVFIVGDEVWKVKRPVDLGFLNFTSLEARRHDCEEEIRLNRRLAPDVYLGVEPVRRTAGGLAVGPGDGAVVDWAVRMRRLPEEASAEAMLGRGNLDPELLIHLAGHVARFLDGARAVPAFGGVETLRASVDENFEQVVPYVGDLVDAATFDEVRAFQTEALTAGAARFAARVREGRIREGHGDLRLEHVYFGRAGQLAIIDCISFNERFRCGDVAAEAAFLAMELEAAGRAELAEGFLARFAEASDDFDSYGVIDFYLSYRAWVRGKVAAFVAADATAPAEVRARKRQEARRDFALARCFRGRPINPPFLVAVGGVPGSGKSTLAEGLGRAFAVPVASSDRIRKGLAGMVATARGASELYTAEMTERTYAEALRRAAVVLGSGRGVVVDATFSAARWRAQAAEVAGVFGARFAFVEARCANLETVRARLRARHAGPSVSDAREDQLDLLVQRYEPVGRADPRPTLVVETDGPPERAVADTIHALGRVGLERR